MLLQNILFLKHFSKRYSDQMNKTPFFLQVVLPFNTPALPELPGFDPHGLCHFPSTEGADRLHLGNYCTQHSDTPCCHQTSA